MSSKDTSSELRQAIAQIIAEHRHDPEVHDIPVEKIMSLLAAQKQRWEEEWRKNLPKKIRIPANSHPNNEDRKMREMWNRGWNAALDGVIGEEDGLLATPSDAPAQGHEAITDNEEAR